jgi:hypothetical protein
MRTFFFVFLALALVASGVTAGTLSYNAVIDTSSINGTQGFLDFSFAPGMPPPPSGLVTISNFASDGSLGAPQLTGSAAGDLTSQVTLDNSASFPPNDYYTPLTYGNLLKFTFTFSGLAVTAPDPLSGGSTFFFSMLDNASNPVLVQSPLPPDDPGGFAVTVDLNPDGSTTVHNYTTTGRVTPVPPVGAVPEPNMAAALMACLGGIGLIQLRRKRM